MNRYKVSDKVIIVKPLAGYANRRTIQAGVIVKTVDNNGAYSYEVADGNGKIFDKPDERDIYYINEFFSLIKLEMGKLKV